jgi:hypothetical protein
VKERHGEQVEAINEHEVRKLLGAPTRYLLAERRPQSFMTEVFKHV